MRAITVWLAATLLAGCFSSDVDPPELRLTARSATVCPAECPPPVALPVGFGGEVWAHFHYQGGQIVPATSTTWSWEPSSVVDLPDAGASYAYATVVAVGSGSATVTVRSEMHGIEDTIAFRGLGFVSIEFDPPEPEVRVGGTTDVFALGTAESGDSYDLAGSVAGSAEWTSDAPAIATVDGGVVSGLAPGQATITAAFEGVSGSTTVTVTE